MEGKSETIRSTFKELEYKLTAISMELFLEILEEIAKIEEFVKAEIFGVEVRKVSFFILNPIPIIYNMPYSIKIYI
jgi:hypothetical protein